MSKKEQIPAETYDLVVRQVDERLHGKIRAAVESAEENPRDLVAERVSETTGEITHHRIPLRILMLDDRGHEVLDPVPVAPPVSQAPMSTFDMIREYNRRQQMQNDWPDADLIDEDNFDIPDDPVDPNTQWETSFHGPSIDEIFARARQVISERKQKAPTKPADGVPPSDGPPPPQNPQSD